MGPSSSVLSQQNVISMTGNDQSDDFSIGVMDSRDEESPDYEINPILSCSNTNFGGKDPAVQGATAGRVMTPVRDEKGDDYYEVQA